MNSFEVTQDLRDRLARTLILASATHRHTKADFDELEALPAEELLKLAREAKHWGIIETSVENVVKELQKETQAHGKE